MDTQFTFFYVTGLVDQLTLEGTSVKIEKILGDGHIIRAGRLLCQESREVLKNRLKGTKVKVSKFRLNSRLCEKCQEEYKRIFSSAWATWVNGMPKEGGVTVVSKEHAS